MASVTATLEFYNGTDWVDISDDMIAGSLSWSGGIRGNKPTDRVAMPGSLDVELNNSQGNSAATLGYYSPDHASKRAGWEIGAKIRVKLESGGDTRYWMYRITSITPVPGQYGKRRVKVVAKCYMNEFSKRKVSGLSIQRSKRGDELLTTLTNSMPFAPANTSYSEGAFISPFAFHNEQDESTYCLSVVQKISQTDLSYIFWDGNTTDGETLHFEPHTTRQNMLTPSGTISDTMVDMEIDHSTDSVWNYVNAYTYPVEEELEISVLGEISSEFSLEPGEERTITIPYLDDVTERRISGQNIVTPEANTDYRMSSATNNGGNDFNSYFTMTPTAGANTLSVNVENTGTSKGYVNMLHVRGYKVKTSEKVGLISLDQPSINAYGEKSITFNMPYQSSAVLGKAVADEILRRFKDPASNISGVSFIANRSTTLMNYALTFGISTRIVVIETVTGVNSGFFINGFDYELKAGNILHVSLTLERAFNDTRYFTLDDATYGVLDGAYTLAPF